MEQVKLKDFCKKEYETLITTPSSSNPRTISGNNGRWTREEHMKFIEALQMYGKNWRRVEEYIGTRTGAQIRSHAQKFFIRIEKEQSRKRDRDKSNGNDGSTSTVKSTQVDSHKQDISSDLDSKDDSSKDVTLAIKTEKTIGKNYLLTPNLSFNACAHPIYQEKKEVEKKIIPQNLIIDTYVERQQQETIKYDIISKYDDNPAKLIPDDNYKMEFIEDQCLLQQQRNFPHSQLQRIINQSITKNSDDQEQALCDIVKKYDKNQLFIDDELSYLLEQDQQDDGLPKQVKKFRKMSQNIFIDEDLKQYNLDAYKKKIKQNPEQSSQQLQQQQKQQQQWQQQQQQQQQINSKDIRVRKSTL